ncbi:MAG: hypothetical protein Q9166_007184 [cf. Caloplaca sp. 2 TL-2023]
MPAPLAKAGLAVYEHPQVKQWVDESRRKIAFALHNLGDDLEPPSSSRRNSSQDVSTREDNSAEAAERRRKARQEILDRGRKMEEKRKAQQPSSVKSRSFDDLVDEEGKLKHGVAQATTSATETHVEPHHLRNRNTEAHGVASGTAFANTFAEETYLQEISVNTIPVQMSTYRSRSSSTATLPASPAPPPVPPKEPLDHLPLNSSSRPQQQPLLLIDTDDVSNHPSEALLDLTPTTSASSVAVDLYESDQQSHPSNFSEANFWSVHEWAENTSTPAHFYTPPRSEAAIGDEPRTTQDERSNNGDERIETGSGERISRSGSVGDMDVMSEVSGVSTPGSWTELGSQISEDF